MGKSKKVEADRVITIPDAGGDLMLTGGVGQVGNTNIADNTITSAKFNSAVKKAINKEADIPIELSNLFDKKEKMTILPNNTNKVKNYLLENI